jgi:hypothetical protein
MTGDQDDMLARIKSLLPRGWFVGDTPVLDALLSGFAWSLSLIYSLIQYARLQTRIGTATDGFLDLIAFDFFGITLPRRLQEQDDPFRARILATLLREKVTRNGMIAALVNLTGIAPIIFEPGRPADTGAYGVSTSGYGMAGGYGSLQLTAQAFIKAFRPAGSGIPFVAGYGASSGGYGTPSRAAWSSLSQIQGFVTDTDIFSTIAKTKAEGTTMWVQLQS